MTNFCIEDDSDNFFTFEKEVFNISENKNKDIKIKKNNNTYLDPHDEKKDKNIEHYQNEKSFNNFQNEKIEKEINNDLNFGIWSINCDNRIKNNINDFNIEECSRIINNLKLKTFTYNDKYVKDNKKYVGLVAQDIEKILPESIKTQKKNINNILIKDFKMVDIDQIIKHLIGTVQYLSNKIDHIENILDNIKENNISNISNISNSSNISSITNISNTNIQDNNTKDNLNKNVQKDIINSLSYENISKNILNDNLYDSSNSEEEIIKIKGPKHAKKILELKNEKIKQKFSKKEKSVNFNPKKSVRQLKKSINTHIKKSIKNSKNKKESKKKNKVIHVEKEKHQEKNTDNQLIKYVKPEMVKVIEDDIISINIDHLEPTNNKLIEYISDKKIEQNICEYIYVRGKNAGNRCSKKLNNKDKYCNIHKKNN